MNHLRPPQRVSFPIPRFRWPSYRHATAWLQYNGHIHDTTEFLVAGVLLHIVKAKGRWSLDSFHEIPLSHILEFNSHLSQMQMTYLRPPGLTWALTSGIPDATSPRIFVGFFVHPDSSSPSLAKSLLAGIYLSFTFYILFILIICEIFCFHALNPSHVLITNWENQTVYFQFLIQSPIWLAQSLLFTIRWHCNYGMSIVTKITFIYNNRLKWCF